MVDKGIGVAVNRQSVLRLLPVGAHQLLAGVDGIASGQDGVIALKLPDRQTILPGDEGKALTSHHRMYLLGKAHTNIEFGSKLHISLVDGYARIERLDFEPFNESEDLWWAVARYRECYGCYPERILADKIYRNRQTLVFCKEHGIHLSDPALGKPPKDSVLIRQAKK